MGSAVRSRAVRKRSGSVLRKLKQIAETVLAILARGQIAVGRPEQQSCAGSYKCRPCDQITLSNNSPLLFTFLYA